MSTDPANKREDPLYDKRLRADVDEILRRVDALPTLDSRTANEILGYDENGVLRSVGNARSDSR